MSIQFLSAEEACAMVPDYATVGLIGGGGGLVEATLLHEHMEKRARRRAGKAQRVSRPGARLYFNSRSTSSTPVTPRITLITRRRCFKSLISIVTLIRP